MKLYNPTDLFRSFRARKILRNHVSVVPGIATHEIMIIRKSRENTPLWIVPLYAQVLRIDPGPLSPLGPWSQKHFWFPDVEGPYLACEKYSDDHYWCWGDSVGS